MLLHTEPANFNPTNPIAFVQANGKSVICFFPPNEVYDPENPEVEAMISGVHFKKDSGQFAGLRVRRVKPTDIKVRFANFEVVGKGMTAPAFKLDIDNCPTELISISPGLLAKFVRKQPKTTIPPDVQYSGWAGYNDKNTLLRLEGVDSIETLDLDLVFNPVNVA